VVRQMTARVRDLDLLAGVLDAVVAAGANEMQGAQMSAADASSAEHVALEAAMNAARARAEVLAAAAGVTIGSVARVEEEEGFGGPPMPKMGMMAMAQEADAGTEVSAAELTVTRRIRAWFSIA
jgi:uncharacterized protein YggE